MEKILLKIAERKLNEWRNGTLSVVTSLGPSAFMATGASEEVKGLIRSDGSLIFWRRDLSDVYPDGKGSWDNSRHIWL